MSTPQGTPTAPSQQEDDGKKRKIIIIVAIILAIVGAVSARPAWRQVKKMRAASFARESMAFKGEKRYLDAYRKANAALQVDPGNIELLRLAASILTESDDPAAANAWRFVADHPEAKLDDKEEFVEQALKANQVQVAGPRLKELVSKEPISWRSCFLAARFFQLQGDAPRAIQYAQESLKRNQNNRACALLLGSLLVETTSEKEQGVGRKLLWAVMTTNDAVRVNSIQTLARMKLPKAENDRLIATVTENKTPSLEEFFLRQEILLKNFPDQKKKYVSEAVTKYRLGSVIEQAALGAWLNAHEEFASTLQSLTPSGNSKNGRLSLLYVDALIALDKWQDAYDFLTKNETGLDSAIVEAMRAACARKLSKLDLEKVHWKKAIDDGVAHPSTLLTVASIAERMNAPDQAMIAYQKMSENKKFVMPASQNMLRLMQKLGDTRGMRELTAKLLESDQGKFDPGLQNYNAYLNILLNEDVANSKATIDRLLQTKPTDMTFRTSLALANLRTRDMQAAYELFGDTNYNYSTFPPAAKAIYAAVMASKNEKLAKEVAATIEPGQLKPEEQQLVQKWLKTK